MKYLAKEEAIISAARDKRVLHLGCVGMSDATYEDRVASAQKSLHAQLSAVSDVVGIDISRQVIDEFARTGVFRNILVGDVEKLEAVPLQGPFDVVVAGDIIEHITNPGAMLEGLKRFLTSSTRIIITTPHAFGLPNYLRYVAGRFSEGAEHVLSFNGITLQQMLERHDYEVEEIHTCYQPHAKLKGITFRLGRAFFRRFPRFGGTLYVVARARTR
jgi:2-polyprenyl-3-methyl-5-hydroxy-6-metoxy-1,4-benzoquinol methylase